MDKKTEEIIEKAWYSEYEEKRANKIKENFDSWLENNNIRSNKFWTERYTTAPILEVQNKAQAILWIEVIIGQMSDGWWSNSISSTHNYLINSLHNKGYKAYYDAIIKITGNKPVYIAESVWKKPKYNLLDLVKEKGLTGRMLQYIRYTVNPNYTYKDLRRDLKELNIAIKNWVLT